MQIVKPTRANMIYHLLEYQFNIVGKTYEDTIKEHRWKTEWTITEAQLEQFRDYAIPLIKKVFRCNKSKAQGTFDWFQEHLGLRIDG